MIFRNNNSSEVVADPSRRRFFRGQVKTKQTLRLPWVINEAVFTAGCTQCQECISSCETQIIVKDQDGFPKVDFTLGECTFCNACIDSCKQPLFFNSFSDDSTLDNTQKAWPISLNINDKCLAKNNIYCQSCRDECETSAIKFSFLDSAIPQPQLNDIDCTQCGACISSCPQDAINIAFHTTTKPKTYQRRD